MHDRPAYTPGPMRAKDLMTKEVLAVGKEENLDDVMETMARHRVSKLLVIDKGALVGVLTDGDIADELGAIKNRGVATAHLHASGAMRRQFASVAPDTPLRALLEPLIEQGAGILPVLHDNVPLGVVTASDVLSLVASTKPLADVMTSRLHLLAPEDRVIHARRMMIDHHIERLPVLDRGVLVGIVGEIDIAAGLARMRRTVSDTHQTAALQRLQVRDIMQQKVTTATPEMSAREAVDLMRKEDVGSLPVLRDGRLVGIVTRTDLLKLVPG